MLTDAEIDAMQARCDAATPGPWVTLVFAGRHTNSYRDLISISNKTATRVDGKPFKNGKDRLRWFDPTRDDGDFIAESRTDLPRLIAAYRELRKELTDLKAVVNTMNGVSLHQSNRISGDPLITVHPLACGNDSNHTPLYPWWDGTKVCLICRDCGYTQGSSGPV